MGELLPMNKMHEQVKEIQKAADSNDGGATLCAVTDLVKKTSIECHKLYFKLLLGGNYRFQS